MLLLVSGSGPGGGKSNGLAELLPKGEAQFGTDCLLLGSARGYVFDAPEFLLYIGARMLSSSGAISSSPTSCFSMVAASECEDIFRCIATDLIVVGALLVAPGL